MTDHPGSSFQSLLRRAPLWVIFLVVAVLWTALMLGIRWLRGQEISPETVVINAVFGLAFAGFLILLGRWMNARGRRKPPGAPTGTNISQGMTTGRPPEHASADEWVPELRKIIRQERRWAWVGSLAFGLFAILGVFLVIDKPQHPWLGLLAIAGGLGAGVLYPVWVPLRRARIEALIAQFPEGATEPRTS
jgi:MFS family permease